MHLQEHVSCYSAAKLRHHSSFLACKRFQSVIRRPAKNGWFFSNDCHRMAGARIRLQPTAGEIVHPGASSHLPPDERLFLPRDARRPGKGEANYFHHEVGQTNRGRGTNRGRDGTEERPAEQHPRAEGPRRRGRRTEFCHVRRISRFVQAWKQSGPMASTPTKQPRVGNPRAVRSRPAGRMWRCVDASFHSKSAGVTC